MAAAESDAARANAARELEFAGLYADHDRLLAERGALDFGDLIVRAFRLLHEKPHVRERVSERFRHVLVDEYQDTNFAQGMLLRLLVEEHRNVTVVGDDDQAIYRFRGASQKNLLDFEREFPDAEVVRLERNYRSGRRILDGRARGGRAVPRPDRQEAHAAAAGGRVRFWRCRSERAQAQAVAAEAERLIAEGVSPDRDLRAGALGEERGRGDRRRRSRSGRCPFRLTGSAAYFQRAEVRDVLAWLRLLADPGDSGAVVRALSRPPIELRSVDVARLTQLARRRKLDMPSAIAAALEGPQLSPEGRDRARAFLRLYRSASRAFEDRRPDAFVLRLIERIGPAPPAGVRHPGRHRRAAAQHREAAGARHRLHAPRAAGHRARLHPLPRRRGRVGAARGGGDRRRRAAPAVRVMTMHAAKGLEFDHVFVLGLSAARMPGPGAGARDDVPDELLKERLPGGDPREAHEAEMRRLLHVAMTRARKGLVLAWAEPGRPAPRRGRRRSTRRRARRSRPRRRSSRRSCSGRPRACTRPSG